MCLPDRVLAYGDCAIVPNPTSEQLADIAISSARTAAQFGIEPRVAMLSYSTGDSRRRCRRRQGQDGNGIGASTGTGSAGRGSHSVRRRDRTVVAATKMRDSPVAGRATVLIFPDLNTGNNTYKAVQRSAGAIAIGPVLQGLRKPVNDLSRGALVEDIVNTVAITAIQAQGSVMADAPARSCWCINSGSSSLKYQLVDPDSGRGAAGAATSQRDRQRSRRRSPTTTAALRLAFDTLADDGIDLNACGLVGGRAPGCARRRDVLPADLIDDAVIAELESCRSWRRCTIRRRSRRSRSRENCCPMFRTSRCSTPRSFTTCRAAAATYAIDRELAKRWQIRRYGFHGTSHRYVSEQAADVSRQTAGELESDRAAPGQRRVGVGDRRRPARRHLDGADPVGGPGDGHPQRRHRSRRHQLPVAHGEHERRGDRIDAQPTSPGCWAWPVSVTSGGCAR